MKRGVLETMSLVFLLVGMVAGLVSGTVASDLDVNVLAPALSAAGVWFVGAAVLKVGAEVVRAIGRQSGD